jgi:hypothetical protein
MQGSLGEDEEEGVVGNERPMVESQNQKERAAATNDEERKG